MSEEHEEAPEPAVCRSCGAPVDPQALVCVECGARVALAQERSWGRDRLAPIAAVLVVLIVLGAGLAGFAIAELTSDDGGTDDTERAAAQIQAPAAEAPSAEAPSVVGGQGQGSRRSEETAPAEEPADVAGSRGIPGWPAGLSAHTVVLVTTSDRPAARAVARAARGAGLEAGLVSAEPFNLGSGLWIVFTGRFDTREGAVRQAAGLQERYPGAYPQLLQRSQ